MSIQYPPTNELEEYFVYRAFKGLEARGLSDKQEYIDRLEHEIGVIIKAGFAGYFLVVSDILKKAIENNILIGPARGSIGGSLVAYVLYITHIDPIKYNLLFERFLNLHRVSNPDADIDIEKKKREELIKIVADTYGHDRIAHIGTFGSQKAKAAIRNSARTLGYPLDMADELAKLTLGLVQGRPTTLKDSLEQVKELQEAYAAPGSKKEILDYALRAEDILTNIGQHAAGIIISNNPIDETLPILYDSEGIAVSQWEMKNVEEAGLIKFDFLGLTTLSVIHDCIDLIKAKDPNFNIDIYNLPIDDKEVYARLRTGDSVGLFQLDQGKGIVDLLVKIKPTSIEDLITLVAAYRPGPMGSDDLGEYLEVKAGKKEPEYLIPELKPILENTSNLIIYQEQCCAEGSSVWTPRGNINIENLKIGDEVWTNSSIDVITNIACTGAKTCYKVITSAGNADFTDNHKFKCFNGVDYIFKETKDLRINDLICRSVIEPKWKTKEVADEEILEAYRIGILLGDGCISKYCNISTGSEEFADHLISIFQNWGEITKYFATRSWYIHIKQLGGRGPSVSKGKCRSKIVQKLKDYGLLGCNAFNKKIPEHIKQHPMLLQACLLGLIDTDGSVLENCPWHITTVSPMLQSDIEWAFNALKVDTVRRENRIYFSNFEWEFVKNIVKPYKILPTYHHDSESMVYARVDVNREILQNKPQNISLKEWCKNIGYDPQHLWRKLSWIRKSSIPSCVLNKLQSLNIPTYSYVKSVQEIGIRKVWDITTKNTHEFNVSGHVVHNCMKISVDLCGYTPGESDNLRKIIGKKQIDKLPAEHDKFINGWIAQGYPKDKGEQLWGKIVSFGSYGFNRAHAAAYGYITYITAYLKTHYPSEYMCACLMKEDNTQDDIIKYLGECKRLGIQILPPDVNESNKMFSVNREGNIRFGLSAIKHLGISPATVIEEERNANGPFRSIDDFCARTSALSINKLKVSCLIKAGAFDFTGKSRQTLLATAEAIWAYNDKLLSYQNKMITYEKKLQGYNERLAEIERAKIEGLKKLPAPKKLPEKPEEPVFPVISPLEEFAYSDLQQIEKELIGFYVSCHPIEFIEKVDDAETIEDIKRFGSGTFITVVGMPVSTQEITTSKKKKMMYMTLEDLTGRIEVTIFPTTLEKFGHILKEEKPLVISGILDVYETDDATTTKIIARAIDFAKLKDSSKSVILSSKFVSLDKLETAKDKGLPTQVSIKLQDNHLLTFTKSIKLDHKQLRGLK